MSESEPDQEAKKPTSLGIYDRSEPPSVTGIEFAAAALSLIWLVVSVVFLVEPGGQWGEFIVPALTVFLPVLMIWVAALALRNGRIAREECARLQIAIDVIRNTYITQQQRTSSTYEPTVRKTLDEITETAKKTQSSLATASTNRVELARPSSRSSEPANQASLELGILTEEIAPPLPKSVFLRALDFPETPDDAEGFDALRLALKDRKAAQLVQASQDVLNLLSQEGIYMDDLRPDMARPEAWRKFAQGARGREIATLGGIRDRATLSLTAVRMKQDSIFRDAAHHFLRRFDHMIADFETEASDAELITLGETRTARAFMLVGRVAGTFD